MMHIPAVPNSSNGPIQHVEDPSIHCMVERILAEFIPIPERAGYLIDRLAVGGQAQIFAVRTRDGRPILEKHDKLIVKLFDPKMPELAHVVENSFNSLSRLREALDGCCINGWTFSCPLPLHRSHSIFSLVMTAVKGSSLNSMLRTGNDCSIAMFNSIGQTVAAALQRFWSSQGLMYGDLNLHNILWEPESRTLSFVDCGVPDHTWRCDGVRDQWNPASRDLAYLLYSAASAVRASLGKPRALRREKLLTEVILRACVRQLASPDQRQNLLDEIEACAGVHLSTILASWSPAGIWRRVVRYSASRSIHKTLGFLSRDILQPADPATDDAAAEVVA